MYVVSLIENGFIHANTCTNQCERIGHTETTIQQRPSASRVVIVHGVVVCNLAETRASGYLRRIYTAPQNDNSTLHDGTTTWWEQCHGQEEGHALTKENCKVILVISASLTILQKMSFTLCHYAWYLEGECNLNATYWRVGGGDLYQTLEIDMVPSKNDKSSISHWIVFDFHSPPHTNAMFAHIVFYHRILNDSYTW